MDIADKIIDEIVKDIVGRSGLGNEWDGIDDSIKNEIKLEWADIIRKNMLKTNYMMDFTIKGE